MPEQLPDYHQRAFAHNYHAPFIYHVLLKKSEEAPCFGTVAGDARIPPGRRGAAYIKETVLGGIVAKTVFHLPSFLPIIQVYQYVVMPDHVHILMRVKEWSEYHLDYYIEWLKGRICENYSRITDKAIAPEDIFTRGYCDKPLLLGRSLEALFRYIRENPHRLAVRLQFPEFFRRIRKLQIGEEEFEAYGNLFLFRNPDKEAVKISRKFTPQEKE